VLPPTSTSIARYLFDKFPSEKSDAPYQNACVVYTEVDKKAAAIWLFIALGLSTVAGVAAGVGGENANLGFDVGTCVLAVLSVVQGFLLLWQS
jgi:hypothetical protein